MNIMPTIIIGNMEIELPAIHIMNKFIGNCFRGPNAMSQDFYNNVNQNSPQHYANLKILEYKAHHSPTKIS